MTKMRSASETIAGVSFRDRWPVRSRPRSIPTSSASSVAGTLSHAFVPALETFRASNPRRSAILRASASARGLRQVLPLHTKSRFIVQASPTRSGTLSRSFAAGIAPGRITRGSLPVQSDDGRGLGIAQPSTIENPERAATDSVTPLGNDLVGRSRRGDTGSVGARRSDRIAVRQDQARQRAVRSPPYGYAAFRAPQSIRYTLLSAG